MRIKRLRTRILISFFLVTIIPTIIISVISWGNTIQIVKNNTSELTQVNLEQINNNINLTLKAYEDLLFQLYTDDDVVKLVNNINGNNNTALYSNQLIRMLREVANIKPYIESVMIIPANGKKIFYDKLTAATIKSSWVDNYSIHPEKIYKEVINSNSKYIYPTEYASMINDERYYLFHVAHRIIDYRNVDKEIGIIILSLNEELLYQICNQQPRINQKEYMESSLNFIVNENNKILSFPIEETIGMGIPDDHNKESMQEVEYKKLVYDSGLFEGKEVFINYVMDSETGWTIINVTNNEKIIQETQLQLQLMCLLIIVSIIALSIVSLVVTIHLTSSIRKIKEVMKDVANGQLSARVTCNKDMPEEIAMIANQFNDTMEKLENSIKMESLAKERQKNAEIGFLEAQINPHFLYNTLDTINWMAIDEDQYELSNAINALAYILRYGIDKSNKQVTIGKEMEWLKQYTALQQYRLKNAFEVQVKVDPNVMNCYIHKLLLQPFVENTIIHGFDKEKKKLTLHINIRGMGDEIEIVIQDNGKGMDDTLIQEINLNLQQEYGDNHIGIRNAVERIRMYYGEKASVRIKSIIKIGTEIIIHIPSSTNSEVGVDENSDC